VAVDGVVGAVEGGEVGGVGCIGEVDVIIFILLNKNNNIISF